MSRTDEHSDVSAALPAPAPVPTDPPSGRIRVAWVAGPDTVEQYGRALQPLAIGLLDELIDIVALCPQGADVQELPSPPVETLACPRPGA